MTARIMLDARLDTSAAEKLRSQLRFAVGNDLILDANDVERIGGLCLEALLTAKQVWAKSGHQMQLKNCSQEFLDDLGSLGVQPGDLICGEPVG